MVNLAIHCPLEIPMSPMSDSDERPGVEPTSDGDKQSDIESVSGSDKCNDESRVQLADLLGLCGERFEDEQVELLEGLQ